MHPLEYTTSQDIFFDFCLWDYRPSVPYENKFRSVNLLYNSFDCTGVHERFFDLVQAIRQGLGESNTVWGIKQIEGDIRWEFYFYDYGRMERKRSITRLLDIIKPFIRCGIEANENFYYFMFSIDISGELIAKNSDLQEIHMYIGNPGSNVSSGICYSLTAEGTRLENFYFFFDAKKEMDDITDKVICSSYLDFSKKGRCCLK